MGLFTTRTASSVKATRKMVEEVILELKLNPEENRLHLEGDQQGWGLMKGSAEVFIFIIPGLVDDKYHSFQVVSPLMKLPNSPSNQAALFRKLLELNAEALSGVAFGVKGDTVVIVADRSTQDLNRSEVREMILRVGYFADLHDDELVSQFGGRRFSE